MNYISNSYLNVQQKDYVEAILNKVDYVVSFCILLGSTSVFSKSSYSSVVNISVLLSILISIAIKKFLGFYYINRRALLVSFFSSIILGFSPVMILMLIHNGGGEKKLFLLACIVPLIILYIYGRIDKFVHNLISVYVFVISIGLLFWVMYSMKLIKPNTELQISWGETRYIPGITPFFWLTQQSTTRFITNEYLFRFTSIYVEGPVFAGVTILMLSLALYFSKITAMKIFVIAIGGYLSFSTTAYIGVTFLLIPYFAHLIKRFPNTSFYNFLKYIYVASSAIIATIVLLSLVQSFLVKTNTNSGQAHILDLASGIAAFQDSPLFGHGIDNFEASWLQFSSGYRGDAAQTSSIMSLLSQGGILLFMSYVIPPVIFLISNNKLNYIIIFTTFFLTLLLCPFEDAVIIYVMIGIFYASATDKTIK